MGAITENPTISLQQNIGAPILFYLADGAPIFGCIGNPENVIAANKRSLALSDNGSIYYKTTDNVNTGWVAVGGGGGGSGTVTSVGLAGNAIFDFSASSVNPIVGAGTFDIDFATQTANKVLASPSSGAAAIPTFRALVNADLGLAAAPPSGGIQYNNGTNGITASNGLKFDFASNTEQVGESTVLKGTTQHFAQLSTGSVKHTVNNPPSNYVWIWGDSLPANNDLLRASVSGNNVTVSSIAASALGFASVNPTSGVLPYNNAGSFADSPVIRLSSTAIGFSSLSTGAALSQTVQGGGGLGAQWLACGRGSSPVTGNGFVGSDIYVNQYTNNGSSMRVGIRYDQGIFLGSGMDLTWTNAADNATNPTKDIGLNRLAAGVLRVTNGSTGAGQLGVGTSTMTTANQFSVNSQVTTRIAGFFEMPNGSSVATIQGVTNGIQSFAFMPSGKLIGGCNIPTSNQQFSAIGNAKSETTGYGSIGTTLTNLASFALVGNALANNGDYLEQDAFGEFENNANNKQLEIVYGATSIFDTTALPFGTAALANWRVNLKIIRTTASSQKVIVTFWCNDGTTKFLQTFTSAAEDMTANKTIQYKGKGVTNNDVYQEYLETKLCVALTS